MGFKNFASLNIALIGKGAAVEAQAAHYVLAGHEVFLAWKNGHKNDIGHRLRSLEGINTCSIEDAAAFADMIVIASPPRDVREIAYWLGDVRGKVIIDASANVHDFEEEQINTIGAIRAITGSSNVVKVFNTNGYEQLLKPLFNHTDTQLLLVGDSLKAKELTKIVCIDLGLTRFMDFGDEATIPLFDEMTKGWRSLALMSTAAEPQPNLVRR